MAEADKTHDDQALGKAIRNLINSGYRVVLDGSGRDVRMELAKHTADKMAFKESVMMISRPEMNFAAFDLLVYCLDKTKRRLDLHGGK